MPLQDLIQGQFACQGFGEAWPAILSVCSTLESSAWTVYGQKRREARAARQWKTWRLHPSLKDADLPTRQDL